MEIPLSTIDSYLAIIFGVLGAIGVCIGIVKFIQNQRDRKIQVHVEKVKGNDHRIRQIRVGYVNKRIEKCNISFKNVKLVWDSTDGQTNFTIVEGVARNAHIQDDIFTEDAEVITRTGNKIIKRVNFKDIDLAP